ncbi:DNA repair protein RecN [Marinirhabdus gelatinilytica]|uniref:DNA repair protein RecN n=1 Tax=Marinirhabdus gelatinilytica TaxID=1703343 RepID=A0A370QES6_9FLAO|nr:DNA repair protein RecN [Marinirhabdus gelatinilytica]RDK86865.1 DNA replication and repair protein RecN [Marinirhabdus gelatinilytica]
MLTSLSIKNYALIEDVKVAFQQGLTTITGETGAGKSILLGALSLILGKRADSSSVKNPDKKCIVEAEFLVAQYKLQLLFKEQDLDYEDHTIIRRELLPSGKSRAFVNDTPVTLQQLQQLGDRLVDIHSQHETRSLLSEKNQLEVLDAVAGNDMVLKQYKEGLQEYRKLQKEVQDLVAEKETAAKELDYHTFLYNELQEASLSNIHQQEIEEEYEKLSNAETIQEALATVLNLFSEEQAGTLETAKEARAQLAKLKTFSSEYENFWQRLQSVIIELDDLEQEINTATETLEASPEQLLQLQSTLQNLYKLQQKHNVASVEELLEIQEELATKLDTTATLDDRIAMLQKSEISAKEHIEEVAQKLHEARKKVVPKIKKEIEQLLNKLGLPHAQIQFTLEEVPELREHGKDALELLFTANKGTGLGNLKKTASGGELSRIMLSIKAVLANHKNLPTLIFDEIDTGVSGEIAQQMANIMEAMSKHMQVFSITHLPQIAAKGDQQIKVYKENTGGTTTTELKTLTEEERIVEIAQIIGGNTLTESAMAHARQLRN